MAQGFGKGLVHGLLFGGAALAVLSLLAQQAEMKDRGAPAVIATEQDAGGTARTEPDAVARASLPSSPVRPTADVPSAGLAPGGQSEPRTDNMPVWDPTPEEAEAPVWDVVRNGNAVPEKAAPEEVAADPVVADTPPKTPGTPAVTRYEIAIDPPEARRDSQTEPALPIESLAPPTAASEFSRPATDLTPPSPAGQTAPTRAALPSGDSASPAREELPTATARVTNPAPTPAGSTAQNLTEPAPARAPTTPAPEAAIPVSPPGQVATPRLDSRPAVRDTEPAPRDSSVPDLFNGLPDLPDLMGET